jgi:hypothetical protein
MKLAQRTGLHTQVYTFICIYSSIYSFFQRCVKWSWRSALDYTLKSTPSYASTLQYILFSSVVWNEVGAAQWITRSSLHLHMHLLFNIFFSALCEVKLAQRTGLHNQVYTFICIYSSIYSFFQRCVKWSCRSALDYTLKYAASYASTLQYILFSSVVWSKVGTEHWIAHSKLNFQEYIEE